MRTLTTIAMLTAILQAACTKAPSSATADNVSPPTLGPVVKNAVPAAPPTIWLALLGEYGSKESTIIIAEDAGQLCAIFDRKDVEMLLMSPEGDYQFPGTSRHTAKRLRFTQDKDGRATGLYLGKTSFPRRKLDGENGETFKVTPVKPVDEVRKAAMEAKPPTEVGKFREPELTELKELDATIRYDIRYATTNNFLSTPFYTSAHAFLQRPAAMALLEVHKKLKPMGYGVIIYDCYRPWYVTKMFWDATPEKFHNFVADPSKGSRHNRGCAVDLGLYHLETGAIAEMVSGYDEFSERAFPNYPGGTSRQRWHRDLLRKLMEEEGFKVYEEEWWHFDYKDWKEYPILNKRFEELNR